MEKEKASASSDQQLSYTLQISSLEANIREDEYDLSLKEREIASMESSMDQTEITAPLSGRVMSVSEDDYSSDAYITIMDVSSYRVQGYINELNLYDLSEGTDVVIRSRVDDSLWYGTISSIDWEGSTLTTTDSYYYTDSMSSSSKYPFYIEVDDTAGLLLGQHVYIEPDYGQYRDTDALMLPAYYIVDSDDDPYVWAASSKGKLEKRSVTLGTYDADLDTYEILTGLTLEDYIAFPEEDLAEGQSVTYYDESSFGTDEDAYYDDYEFYEDDYYDDEYFDDFLYGEDYYYDDDYLYEDDFYYDDDYSYEGFDLEDEDIYYEDDYSYEEDDLYYGDEGDIADPYDGGELVTDQQIEDPVLLVEGG